ncbi:unnamed protein product [Pleuronectes platessa]|uniref:SLC12A transporter C-terminal domain-containing protein n=1 Tax=Pleuronectes platessa TaxID=8262 RepID=A0A9N7YZT2_PLEPL|nr:unnamed protein product [Pleuronectes platessa]
MSVSAPSRSLELGSRVILARCLARGAFDLQYSVCVLRVKEGLDVSHPSQSHGLTLLLPYLMTRRKQLAGCKSLRQDEVLQVHSREAALIVIMMPVGRRGVCPSTLFLVGLDVL